MHHKTYRTVRLYIFTKGNEMALHNLVHEIVEATEGGRTSTNYSLEGWREEKKVSKELKKAGVKPVWGDVVVNKSSFKDMITSLEDLGNDIATMNYSTLIKYGERKLSPGLSLYIAQEQEKRKDEPEFFRAVLSSIKERIAELDANKSTADTFGDCKRRFTKCDKYSILVNCENPSALVFENIQKEIDALKDLQVKAKEVSVEEYIAFLNEKNAANGQDEDGFVKLRDTSKPVEPEVPAEVPASA